MASRRETQESDYSGAESESWIDSDRDDDSGDEETKDAVPQMVGLDQRLLGTSRARPARAALGLQRASPHPEEAQSSTPSPPPGRGKMSLFAESNATGRNDRQGRKTRMASIFATDDLTGEDEPPGLLPPGLGGGAMGRRPSQAIVQPGAMGRRASQALVKAFPPALPQVGARNEREEYRTMIEEAKARLESEKAKLRQVRSECQRDILSLRTKIKDKEKIQDDSDALAADAFKEVGSHFPSGAGEQETGAGDFDDDYQMIFCEVEARLRKELTEHRERQHQKAIALQECLTSASLQQAYSEKLFRGCLKKMNALDVDNAEQLMERLMAADVPDDNFIAANEIMNERVKDAWETMKASGRTEDVNVEMFLNSQVTTKHNKEEMQQTAQRQARMVMFQMKKTEISKANKDKSKDKDKDNDLSDGCESLSSTDAEQLGLGTRSRPGSAKSGRRASTLTQHQRQRKRKQSVQQRGSQRNSTSESRRSTFQNAVKKISIRNSLTQGSNSQGIRTSVVGSGTPSRRQSGGTEQNLDLSVLPIATDADAKARGSLTSGHSQRSSISRDSLKRDSVTSRPGAASLARAQSNPYRFHEKVSSGIPGRAEGRPVEHPSGEASANAADESDAKSNESEDRDGNNVGCQTDLSLEDVSIILRTRKFGRGSLREDPEVHRTTSKRSSMPDVALKSVEGLARGRAVLKRASLPEEMGQLGLLLREGGLVAKESSRSSFSTRASLKTMEAVSTFTRSSLRAKMKRQSADETAISRLEHQSVTHHAQSSMQALVEAADAPPLGSSLVSSFVQAADLVVEHTGVGEPSGEDAEEVTRSTKLGLREKGWVKQLHGNEVGDLVDGPRLDGSPNMHTSNLPLTPGPSAALRSARLQTSPEPEPGTTPEPSREGSRSQEKQDKRRMSQKVYASNHRIPSVEEIEPRYPAKGPTTPSPMPRTEGLASASQFDSNASSIVPSSKPKSTVTGFQSVSKKAAEFLRSWGTTQGADTRKKQTFGATPIVTSAHGMEAIVGKQAKSPTSGDLVGADLAPVAASPWPSFSAGDSSPRREAKKSDGTWLVARTTKALGQLGALRYTAGPGGNSEQPIQMVTPGGNSIVHKPLDSKKSAQPFFNAIMRTKKAGHKLAAGVQAKRGFEAPGGYICSDDDEAA